MSKKENYGPLWQMKQAVESENKKVIAYSDDIERYQKLRQEAMNMAKLYQEAVDVLIGNGFE